MPLPLIGAGMGLFKAANFISKTPFWKGAMKGAAAGLGFAKKAAPVVAKTVAATGAGGAAWGAGQGFGQKVTGYSSGGGLPAIPGMGGMSGLPGAYSGGLPSAGSYSGGMMMPEMLAPNTLRVFYRAPKGFVIVRDPQTRQVIGAVRKDVARRAKLWKPSKKPPISATEWQHYKDAERVEKKLRKIAASAIRKHSRPHHATGYVTRKRK